MRYYAGIGASTTPEPILDIMVEIAQELARRGFTLRSGGAGGADEAFYVGALDEGGSVETWVPWKDFTKGNKIESYLDDYSEYYDYISKFHPAWDRCTQGARKLHARNLKILIGEPIGSYADKSGMDFNLCEFVVCWTPAGRDIGGTGMGIKMAKDLNIPVFNLAIEGEKERLAGYIEEIS